MPNFTGCESEAKAFARERANELNLPLIELPGVNHDLKTGCEDAGVYIRTIHFGDMSARQRIGPRKGENRSLAWLPLPPDAALRAHAAAAGDAIPCLVDGQLDGEARRLAAGCATIRRLRRIASPEMLLNINLLPHLICSFWASGGIGGYEAGEHDDTG